MKFKQILPALALVAFLGLPGWALAEAPEGATIMKMADEAPDGENGRAKVVMILSDSSDGVREREFTIARKDDADQAGESRYFIEFAKPADVKGMRFLIWDHAQGADDRWMFLPRLKMVRRIAAEDERGAFVGSDFVYEDISGRDPSKDTHSYERTEKVGDRETWVVTSTPKETTGVEFAKKTSWVDTENHLVLKEEYFAANGEKIKESVTEKVETVQGIPTKTSWTMKNLKSGHKTNMKIGEVRYDVDDLDDNQFEERALKRR